MAFIIEPDGKDIMLTITSTEEFVAVTYPDGKITLTGPKDAFLGLGELLMDGMEDE